MYLIHIVSKSVLRFTTKNSMAREFSLFLLHLSQTYLLLSFFLITILLQGSVGCSCLDSSLSNLSDLYILPDLKKKKEANWSNLKMTVLEFKQSVGSQRKCKLLTIWLWSEKHELWSPILLLWEYTQTGLLPLKINVQFFLSNLNKDGWKKAEVHTICT